MISAQLLQVAFVARLKAEPTIAAVTTDVRERGYKGKDFTYPNLRVGLGTILPYTYSNRREKHATWFVTVEAFSDQDASDEVSQLSGIVVNALFGHQLYDVPNSWYIATINCKGLLSPTRHTPELWRGDVYFYGRLYQQN